MTIKGKAAMTKDKVSVIAGQIRPAGGTTSNASIDTHLVMPGRAPERSTVSVTSGGHSSGSMDLISINKRLSGEVRVQPHSTSSGLKPRSAR